MRRIQISIHNNAYRSITIYDGHKCECASVDRIPASIPWPHIFIYFGICFGWKLRMRKINIHLHIHLARLAHVKHVYTRAHSLYTEAEAKVRAGERERWSVVR